MTLSRPSVNGWRRDQPRRRLPRAWSSSVVVSVLVVLARLDVRVRVAGVGGRGGESGDGLVALARFAQEVLDVRRVLGDRVGDELERRGQSHVEVLADLGAQHPGRRLQRLRRGLPLLGEPSTV